MQNKQKILKVEKVQNYRKNTEKEEEKNGK